MFLTVVATSATMVSVNVNVSKQYSLRNLLLYLL